MGRPKRDTSGKDMELFGGVKTGDQYVISYNRVQDVAAGSDYWTTGSRAAGNPTGSVTAGAEGAKAFVITTDIAGEGKLYSYYGQRTAISSSILTAGVVYPIALEHVDATEMTAGSVLLLY